MPNPNPQLGDICWVKVPQHHTVGSEQYKRRPWIIVSSSALSNLKVVVGVPLSMQAQKQNPLFRIAIADSEILRDAGSTLIPGDRVALTEQVRALAIERLEFPRTAHLTDTALFAVEAGLAFVLEIH